MDPIEFYNCNKEYKDYVDRFCNEHNISTDEALKHKIIKEDTLEYYLEKSKKEEEENGKNRQRHDNQIM